MKIFLAGQKSFGLAALQLIQKLNHEIVGVSAPREDLKGRLDSLFGYCDVWRIPVVCEKSLTASDIAADTDLIVAAHSHAFIGRKTRNKARHGAIGYHPSLLPRHRGRDAVKWTIKMRDPIGGGSVYWLDDNVDGGPVAAQEFVFVEPQWNAHDLWRELFPLGLFLIRQVLFNLEAGKIVKIPQNEVCATWEPALDPPRLFRPELPQLSHGKSDVQYQVEADFKRTMNFYAID